MAVYDYDKLIAETRRIAYEYRRTTGQTLPLTAEIARFDAKRLLKLDDPPQDLSGVDAIKTIDGQQINYLIKGRAFFKTERSGQRLGALNIDGLWERVLLVQLDETYQTVSIYEATRSRLVETLAMSKPNKRGSITVGKFRAVSEKIWCLDTAQPQ
ncbi:MAG: hypothetical protein AAGB12_00075 [Pseudomonadota bacterium]